MTRRACRCLLAAVVVLAGAPAGALAQPGGPTPGMSQAPIRLTLDQALARGLEASHRVAEARAREDAAKAAVTAREAATRGQVAVQAGYTRTNHVDEFGIALPGGDFRVIYPDIPDNYRSRLDLQWPLFTFGRLEAAVRAASSEADAAGKDVLTAQADLRLEIARAYWTSLTASESVRVVQEALKRIDAHLADVKNRLAVGLVPPSDVFSVQAQRSRQQVLLIEAGNARDIAAADLARLVGVPPGTPIELDARLEDLPAAGDALTPLVDEARAARPERQALESRRAGAGERRLAAEASRRPLVSVGGGVDYARPNPRIFPRLGEFRTSWDASVNFSWPLWDGGRARADVAEAAAGERAIGERLRDFDAMLEVEVRQRRLDLDAALASIGAASEAVESAAEARRIVGNRFTAGVATTTEVLDAQVALLQAELDRTRAMAGAHLAAARLARVLGR